MNSLIRKVQYKMYPNQAQLESMESLRVHHHQLYCWALKDRISTYKEFGYGLSFSDQCKINTQYRQRRSAHGIFNANAQSEQVTLKRVQLAFDGFFRRLKENRKAGFPRFKQFERFKGWGYKSHGDGWKLSLNPKKHGAVYLADVGIVKIRGQARNECGVPKTAEVLKRQDGWYLSVSFEYSAIQREAGNRAVALDWGLEHYATVVDDTGNVDQIDNPRYFRKSQEKLSELQREFALCKKRSREWKFLKSCISRLHQKIGNQRKDFIHQKSAEIISTSAILAFEELNIKNMTRSAKGTVESPGKRVKQKSGLNKSILDASPAAFYASLRYKAEDAGVLLEVAPTRKLKPSQTCPKCGSVKKKTLSERTHSCECGYSAPRDVASAQVVLNWALGNSQARNEPVAA